MAIGILTTGLFPSATVGKSYNFTFTGTSGAPISSPVNVMYLGTLPSGLSFGSGSVDVGGFWFITLSGTPNDNLGTYSGDIVINIPADTPQNLQTAYTMQLGLPSCSTSGNCPAPTVSSGIGSSGSIPQI